MPINLPKTNNPGETYMLKNFILITLWIVLCLPTAAIHAQEGGVMDTIVVFETNQGNIELKLFEDIAPKTCENFIGLIKKDYYDGIIFHRVIENFMIQGGDPTGTGRGGESIWGKPFNDEVTPTVKFDKAGLLAMANAGPNTNGSQFFITTQPTPWLNMNHTIFGEVVSGMDVVSAIENCDKGPGDRPLQEQKIIKAYIK